MKHLLQRAMETDFATLQQEEIGLFNRLAGEPDTVEGVTSFLEKRPPHWWAVHRRSRRGGPPTHGGTAARPDSVDAHHDPVFGMVDGRLCKR